MNTCKRCGEKSFPRYYVSKIGWCCETCWQFPTICTTRASDVHSMFAPYTPRNFSYLNTKKEHEQYNWVAECAKRIVAKRDPTLTESEKNWHAAVKAGYAAHNRAMGISA